MASFVGVSAQFASSSASTAAYPSGVADGDLILIHAATAVDDAFTMVASGWTLVDDSSTGVADGTHCSTTVLWSNYNAAAPLSLAYNNPGNHVVGFVTAWREFAVAPIGASSTDTQTSLSTSHAATGPTTTNANAYVVLTGSHGDVSTPTLTGYGNLDGALTSVGTGTTTLGNDGTVLVAYGTKATAGAVGDLTWTTASSRRMSAVVVELIPLVETPPASVQLWSLSDGAGGSTPMTMTFSAGGPGTSLSAPLNLVATATTTSSVGLRCDPPANNGGSAIVGYEWQRSTDQVTWTALSATTSTSKNAVGLTAATLYYFRVQADNGVSLSPWSNIASATTTPGTPTPTDLVNVSGIHCILNRTGYNHAQRFGYYAGEYTSGGDSDPGLGFVPMSVLASLDQNGPGVAIGNTSALKTYWGAWGGSRPDIMDVIVPLGFKNTGRSVLQELTYVVNGGYDADYTTIFGNLDDLASTDMHMSLRIGNEANLANAWAHSMLKLPESDRDLFGIALDHVAALARTIISDVSIQYSTQHAATETVAHYVSWAYTSAPAYLRDDTETLVLDWPLNRPEGMTEVDHYSMNLYVGNKTAAGLVNDLDILENAGIRDGKTIAVPEWGIDYRRVTPSVALTSLQTMVDALHAVGTRLVFQQYFEDQSTWMLHRTSNWGGQNLLDNYGAMVLAAT